MSSAPACDLHVNIDRECSTCVNHRRVQLQAELDLLNAGSFAQPAVPNPATSMSSSSIAASSDEGVNLDDPMSIRRDKRCKQILKLVDVDGAVLIRAPPFTGKSSLASLLSQYAANSQKYSQIIKLTLLQWNAATTEIQDFFKERNSAGKTFAQLLSEPTEGDKHILIILDEAQKLYPLTQIDIFWQRVKAHMDPEQRRNSGVKVHVVLFAAYGESPGQGDIASSSADSSATGTPLEFLNAFGMELLRLDSDEFQTLVTAHNKKEKLFPLSDINATRVLTVTGGHVGFVVQTLKFGRKHFKSLATSSRPTVAPTEVEVNGILLSSDYLSFIRQTRAFSALSKWSLRSSESKITIIESVLSNPSFTITDPANSEKAVKELISCAVLARVEGRKLGFASPLIRCLVTNLMYAPTELSNTQHSFHQFLKLVIQGISQDVLRETLSKGIDGQIYERQMQMEFNRVAIQVMGAHHQCWPDVGFLFGAQGSLDFYLGDRQWAVELTRNSDRLPEHFHRFGPAGKYHNIPMKEKVVLNFEQMNRPLEKLSNFTRPKNPLEWRIFFHPNSPSVIVRYFKHPKARIFVQETLPFLHPSAVPQVLVESWYASRPAAKRTLTLEKTIDEEEDYEDTPAAKRARISNSDASEPNSDDEEKNDDSQQSAARANEDLASDTSEPKIEIEIESSSADEEQVDGSSTKAAKDEQNDDTVDAEENQVDDDEAMAAGEESGVDSVVLSSAKSSEDSAEEADQDEAEGAEEADEPAPDDDGEKDPASDVEEESEDDSEQQSGSEESSAEESDHSEDEVSKKSPKNVALSSKASGAKSATAAKLRAKPTPKSASSDPESSAEASTSSGESPRPRARKKYVMKMLEEEE